MRIGIVAPSCGASREVAARVTAFAAERFPGAELVWHPQCFLRHGHFAGPDDARAAAFVEAANDPALDAVWFARGGYGSVRIVERAMAGLGGAARGKRYMGYSDGGTLLAALYAAGTGRPAWGPMPHDIARVGGEAAVARALGWLIGEEAQALEPSIAPGTPYAAFNLVILAHLLGTPWLPDLSGHVLMLEEVSEPMYRIDRAFAQLAHSPAFRRVAGVRLGRVSGVVANDPEFEGDEEAVARHWCGVAGVPFLGRADIGHDAANKVVPFGPC